MYFSQELNEMQYKLPQIFHENTVITFSGLSSSKSFQTLGQIINFNHDSLEKTQCLPLYRYEKSGSRLDNMTDWGLARFREHYELDKSKSFENDFIKYMHLTKHENNYKITKEDIFHHTYAVLHNPSYRTKYELNLKREFPRIPFYPIFHQWAAWGKALMDLHINYESVALFPLKEITVFSQNEKVKPKLKADKLAGKIMLRCP